MRAIGAEVTFMVLRGSISVMALADVLQWLGSARKSGVLELESNRVTTRVYYGNGRIIGCSSEDPPKLLGQFLLFHGQITEDVLRESLAVQESTGRSLREILEENGLMTSEVMDRMVAAKAEETILSLFQLKEAGFAFTENVDPPAMAMDVDLDVQDLLLHGMKRLDDMQRIRERFDLGGVPVRTGADVRPAIAEDGSSYRIYQAIDGRRSIRDIMLLVHGTEYQVCERLLGMCEDGFVEVAQVLETGPAVDEPAGSRELSQGDGGRPGHGFDLDIAQQLLDDGEYEACFEILGEAQKLDPSDTAVCHLLSRAEEALAAAIEREGLTPSKIPIPLVSLEEMVDVHLTPEEEFLLSISDGTWDVKSLIWVAPMRAFQVLSALNSLWGKGFIDIQDAGCPTPEPPMDPAETASGAPPA